jgi:hypothetical protein
LDHHPELVGDFLVSPRLMVGVWVGYHLYLVCHQDFRSLEEDKFI